MSKELCAITGCNKVGKHSMNMQGNFGAMIFFLLCKEHYENRDDYFEWVNEDGSTSKASEKV